MASGIFERELKGILHGNKDILQKVTRTCDPAVRTAYHKIIEKPFIVIRAAGSFGVDLVAIRGDVSFPVEVKSSSSPVLRFSRSERLKEQSNEFMRLCRRSNLIPIYAYRLKNFRGDTWRIFTVSVEKVEGILKIVYQRLPKVERTKDGNMVLRWKNGLPLSTFIEYICR